MNTTEPIHGGLKEQYRDKVSEPSCGSEQLKPSEERRITSALNYSGQRECAKSMLENTAHKLNKRQRDIEIVLAMLPSEMTREQDEAVYNLFNSL